MTIVRILYQAAIAVLRAFSPLLAVGSSKLARGMEGRRHAHEKLAAWGSTLREPARCLLWLHAPSVGEGLQAKAVKDAWVARHPDTQIVFTFFSPSAEAFAEDFGADVTAYLPWDLRGPLARVLEAVRPDAVVFTKTEVWPTLIAEARRHEVPVGIVGATVPEGAGRARRPARAFLAESWAALDLACAISEADAARLVELGVPTPRVHVTGDPGIDSAAMRFHAAPSQAPHLVPFRGGDRPTVVAGSTWEADEAVLVPALATVRAQVADVRTIVAPHEPTKEHVFRLLQELAAEGWRTATLSEVEEAGDASRVDAVVVDRVGVLAHLYGVASVSFVGGGFHDQGLHSVLEPAAAGTPVVFGPRHHNTRAAADLAEAGGAKIAADPSELAGVLLHWLRDDESREQGGRAAAGYIQRHRGAADRTAVHLEEIIHRPA